MLSFATFAVGFLMRPAGGLVFGHISDRIGQKRTLALTMAIMGGSTALMGVLPTAAAIGVAAPILLLALPVVELFRSARSRRNTVLGLLSRWGEGAAFNTWGVFAISFATVQLGFEQVPVLLAVTVAAVVMAALIPVSGLLTGRFGPRRVYIAGIAAYGVLVYPVFLLFETGTIVVFTVAVIACSGLTPMIVTALIAATGGAPWLACGYLVGTAVVNVIATRFISEKDRLTA